MRSVYTHSRRLTVLWGGRCGHFQYTHTHRMTHGFFATAELLVHLFCTLYLFCTCSFYLVQMHT